MKQTKKLTRNQREYLLAHHVDDVAGIRLVEETSKYIKVQNEQGKIMKFIKED